MTATATGLAEPTVVATRPVLADLELVLDGVLAPGHRLGGSVTAPDRAEPVVADGRTGLGVEESVAEAALQAGALLLVDEEQTPLGRLSDLTADADGLRGQLHRVRRRESGTGRAHAVDLETPLDAGTVLVVLARPALRADEDRVLATLTGLTDDPDAQPDPTARDTAPGVLLLVPDHARDTAGVPTHLMTRLAAAFGRRIAAARPGLRVTTGTAPLAWRDPSSDLVLAGALAARLGAAQTVVLHPDAEVDPEAVAWQSAVTGLRFLDHDTDHDTDDDTDHAATLPRPTEVLDPSDLALLSRWRRPRSSTGLVLFFTGFSGSGKSTIARAVHERLLESGERTVTLLDGDVVRQMLSSGLGFDRAGRTLNIRRIGFVAAEIARHGGVAICAPVAPYDAGRKEARSMAEEVGDFLLVHVSTPLEECERRDLKGLYAKARAGLVTEFTGISDPYEVPQDADLVIDTTDVSTDVAVARIMDLLASGGWIKEKTA